MTVFIRDMRVDSFLRKYFRGVVCVRESREERERERDRGHDSSICDRTYLYVMGMICLIPMSVCYRS